MARVGPHFEAVFPNGAHVRFVGVGREARFEGDDRAIVLLMNNRLDRIWWHYFPNPERDIPRAVIAMMNNPDIKVIMEVSAIEYRDGPEVIF